jgi:hypothetical protein
VIGTRVSASPAKATRPIRSNSRAAMKEMDCSLATSSRLEGAKSSASIELETSTASTIAMPSLVVSSDEIPYSGPAAAMIHAARVSVRRAAGVPASHRRPCGAVRNCCASL